VAACRVLCVSRAVFRMSLVMVVRRVLCSVRLHSMLCSVRLHSMLCSVRLHSMLCSVRLHSMLCSVSLTLLSIRRTAILYNFNSEQYMLPEDDRVIETCRSVLNVLMYILDFLNSIYDAYSESKYRFAVKQNRVRFRIKFYCYQILHSSNYFSTYSPPLLRHLS